MNSITSGEDHAMAAAASLNRVELGGVYNVRDLGGWSGHDGRLVRRGMLFRASSLHRLTNESAWREFNATTVIDLRYAREIDAFPLPDFIAGPHHLPMLPDDWQARLDRNAIPASEFLASVYVDMLDLGGNTVAQSLQQLSVPDAYPAVFFCMAGKDRTGILAAVVLTLLGVSEDDIIEDFHLSGDEVVAMVAALRDQEDFEAHPMMNQSEELLRAPREAIEILLDHARSTYGGLDRWVARLGVPEATIERLQTILLG
jgi:protein-tyrosine phosphatase